MGGLSGYGAGLRLEHDAFPGPENQLRCGFLSTLEGGHRARAGLRTRVGGDTRLEFGVGYRFRPNARFFGMGPGASVEKESFYSQALFWGGVSGRRTLSEQLGVTGTLVFSSVESRRAPASDRVGVAERFSGQLPPGYGQRSSGFSAGVRLGWDTTLEDRRPTSGGLWRLGVNAFQASDDADLQYWSYRAEVQRFIPLWHSYRCLAARAYLSCAEVLQGEDIPFQRLLTNDDPDLLRGYGDFRWRDRGMIALSLEYRWPLWNFKSADGLGADWYMLSDVGQVFGEYREIGPAHWTWSRGLGIRLLSDRRYVGRLEFAWSDEAWTFRIRTDQLFQFSAAGLFEGRDPVPER